MREKRKPICFIIAGPNGAGKTTFALRYLTQIAGCRNFINADMIAYGLSPLDSLSVQFEAGRVFLREIHANINKRVDVAFETTLAGRSHINLLKELRQDSWQVRLFFLWIPDADFSRRQVRERVESGGHNIPDDTIYRRYPRVMKNFTRPYVPLCDKVVCYDNSGPEPALVFVQDEKGHEIMDADIYETIAGRAHDH